MLFKGIKTSTLDSYKKLAKWMNQEGCVFVRTGKGSHQIWEKPSGERFVVPKKNKYRGVMIWKIIKIVKE